MFSQRHPQLRPPVAHRRGFTLLEVLIAVGIIAVLATIVTIAISAISSSSKTKSTRVALENCLSLQVEYENTKKLPASLRRSVGANVTVSIPSAIDTTVTAMVKLRQLPKAKEMLERMSAGSVVRLDEVLPSVAIASSVPPTQLVRLWAAATVYAADEVVQYPAGSGMLYISLQDANTGFTPGTPPAAGYWSQVQMPVSTLADAWGNPIFCAGNALRLDRPYSPGLTYQPGEVVNYSSRCYKCIQTSTGNNPPDAAYWVEVASTATYEKKAKEGRVFWVSAGPDGDFLTDDDNIYSFEN